MTMRAQRSWLAIVVALGLAVTAGMSLIFSAAAQDLPLLPPGQPVTGEVTDRDGDLWLVRGCAGDPITITMESDVFTPYLELTDAEDELLADGIGEDGLAVLTSDPLSATTVYTLAAAGDRRSARGAYTLTLTSARVDALTDVDGVVAYGVPVTGEVRSRLGELWGLAGCPGDEVTVTVTSTVFSPYLEIVDLVSGDSLVAGEAEADESAQIAAFAVPAGDAYGIVVAGARIVDRGPYTLSVTTVLTGAVAPASTTPLVTQTARASAPTRTPVPTPSEDTCTVNVEGLNLRSGPDTAYDPPIGSLPLGAELRMLARNPAATWVQVEVAATGEKGWVSASSQFVTCTRYPRELAVGVIPPTPTPLPTPTPTPTFTPTPTPTSRPTQVTVPTPPAFVLLPGGGPSGDGWNTEIVSGRGMVTAVDGVAIFRDRMYVRLEIYSTPNNRDVRSVRFTVVPDGDFDPVNEQTESNAGYCSFGGGEPECNVLRLDSGARWPSSGLSIDNGELHGQHGGGTRKW